MFSKTINSKTIFMQSLLVATATFSTSPMLFAFDVPTGIFEDDDNLCWQSDAPSTNVYEDGIYIGTVHDTNCFGPIFDDSVYQLSAHDHGLNGGFSILSSPYLVVDGEDSDEDSDSELEFEESQLFFELNNTDGDLGLHGKVDGEEWREIVLEDPTGRPLIEIENRGGVALQGLTELFFESAEPTFDNLNPSVFFARFPEGTYEWSGLTVEGEEIEGEAELSHKIPAAPFVYVNGTAIEGCDDIQFIDASATGSYAISWDEVTMRHPVLGDRPGADDVEVDLYQFVLEREEQNVAGEEVTELTVTMDIDSDVLHIDLPAGMIGVGQEIKNEVIARSEEGNQSATEFCWIAN